eukprot:TRINITY_DN23728_c0_g1_i1.p1 TRINITY_DN23728_c0_g1~~TRINITY_DN23728_c0_g1_i1.p1  ORF type:complete len:124 (+),score=54.84 TRINITY_DN23728_c0_g1_i1:121-492(+)
MVRARAETAKATKATKAAKEPKAKKEKISKKKVKDKNAPKKALSAFMMFSKEEREGIKKKNPDAAFGEMGKLMGEAWKKMSDKDKKPYQKMADDDKVRYADAMEAYKGGEAPGDEEEEEEEEE